MGYLGLELQGPSNSLEVRPTQEIIVQIRREGIPNAIVEHLDPTAPEAVPFRFKPVGIGLLSYATSPELMTIATNQC